MASFSFGSGNAAKLLRMPLYAVGRIGSLLVPRGSRWVFGCGAGVGDGALALQRVAADDGHDTVWLTATSDEDAAAAALGIRTVRKSSLRGWWATARAGVIVVTHGFGDVNRYGTGGGFVVQLWHGIPLKRIGLDSSATVQVPPVPGAPILRRIVAMLYRAAAQRIRVLPAASHRSRGRLESAFALGDDRVVVTGEPRVDVLSAGTPTERRERAVSLLEQVLPGVTSAGPVILYAPTWRDGGVDPAIPTAEQWIDIIRMLDDADAVLLIRSHPLGAGAYTPPLPSRRIMALGPGVLSDVTPVLPAVDVLVTDYSSLAFDVGLLAMPVLYLAPDAAEYAGTRGFYGSFDDVAQDEALTDWFAVAERLGAVLRDASTRAKLAERSAALSGRMHAFSDGGNTARVYRTIRARSISAPKGAA